MSVSRDFTCPLTRTSACPWTQEKIIPGWHLQLHGGGSPVVGGGAVWVVDYPGGELRALDPATGRVRKQIAVGAVPHFVSPTLSGGRVFVGTLSGVTAIAGG
ncbi:PQQ-binding-like beta-propeller repeat protein [Streptomyces sp. NPDC056159]|uniref:PQQ-binding-like beta-propeller repeat protein n=1 Tax=Streptomyces sp. NPDC056159 TaxID=3155537 RepID=UPI003425B883